MIRFSVAINTMIMAFSQAHKSGNMDIRGFLLGNKKTAKNQHQNVKED